MRVAYGQRRELGVLERAELLRRASVLQVLHLDERCHWFLLLCRGDVCQPAPIGALELDFIADVDNASRASAATCCRLRRTVAHPADDARDDSGRHVQSSVSKSSPSMTTTPHVMHSNVMLTTGMPYVATSTLWPTCAMSFCSMKFTCSPPVA